MRQRSGSEAARRRMRARAAWGRALLCVTIMGGHAVALSAGFCLQNDGRGTGGAACGRGGDWRERDLPWRRLYASVEDDVVRNARSQVTESVQHGGRLAPPQSRAHGGSGASARARLCCDLAPQVASTLRLKGGGKRLAVVSAHGRADKRVKDAPISRIRLAQRALVLTCTSSEENCLLPSPDAYGARGTANRTRGHSPCLARHVRLQAVSSFHCSRRQ